MKTVAVYARVSTGVQEPENQLIELREHAKESGWAIREEYADINVSGHEVKPELERLMADASRRQFDAVLFWSLDRISRKGAWDTLSILAELESFGLEWHSLKEQYLLGVGTWKDAIVSIMATISHNESLIMSNRIKASLDRARMEGKHLGRPRRTDIEASTIIEMREQGVSWPKMAKQLDIPQSTLRNIYNRAMLEG